MSDPMWTPLVEFALDVQRLVSSGFTLTQEFGDYRFGLSDTLVATRGDEVVRIQSWGDLTEVLRRERELPGGIPNVS